MLFAGGWGEDSVGTVVTSVEGVFCQGAGSTCSVTRVTNARQEYALRIKNEQFNEE